MIDSIDEVSLNFNENSVLVLNICLAIVMFGVALGLHLNDFKQILRAPKSVFLGLFSQFILLPALTFLLIVIIEPQPGIALGMIMVAACPGGNVSNYISQLAGGNVALSVSLTAFSSSMCLFFTPFNLAFWGSLYQPANELLTEVSLNTSDVFGTIVLLLALPLILGMILNHRKNKLAATLGKYLRPISLLILIAIIAVAFLNNQELFQEYFEAIVWLVLLHNAIALACGWLVGFLAKIPEADQRSLSIETGIQNSALGLILIFSFFDGLGGMALVAGWWGIWHIIAGLGIAFFWSKRKVKTVAV